MRILIVTQKIDERDAVLGFMHGWISEFSKQAESVVVICLEKGRVNLPPNVKVLSLGKEENNFQFFRMRRSGFGGQAIFNFQSVLNLKIFKKIKYSLRFVRYIVQLRNEYDAVFVHMNPEYVVLGGWFWKLWGKTVTLWYAHKSVTWHLAIAHFFTDIVFTSTASGFRLKSSKVKVVGQGIDINKFKVKSEKLKVEEGEFKIVTVGRITPSKDYDTLVNAIEIVKKKTDLKITVDIFGPTSSILDDAYLKKLKEKVAQKELDSVINFREAMANVDLPELLPKYDLFVNMGHTGSLDKAVPEAMAVGLPVLTCNEAFKEVLGRFTAYLMYPKGDFEALSEGILKIGNMAENERQDLGKNLREIVVEKHSLKSFVDRILFEIESLKKKKPVSE